MSQGRITIQQIADTLRLSTYSVSRALSGKDGVGEETRARVLSAAHHLGYRARADGPATRQVLFLMQDEDGVSGEMRMNLLHGAEREAERRAMTVVPRQIRRPDQIGVPDPSVVGLVLAAARPEPFIAPAKATGLPVTCAGHAPPLAPVDQVAGANWEAGVVVARFLAGLGHRSLAFVQGHGGLFGRRERLRGLRDGAQEVAGTSVQDLTFDEPGGFRSAFAALLRAGAPPTALFCAHDGLAVTAVSELVRLGIRVPEDVSVVGYFDFVSATQIVPQLTTMRVPQEQIGAAAIRCIAHRLLAGGEAQLPPLRLALAPTLVERASTAPARLPSWSERVLDALGRPDAVASGRMAARDEQLPAALP